MDTCSTELLIIIFEFACSDGLGQIARQLGLVSRRFRAIAEPIEMRTVTVGGIIQLQRILVRLERLNAATSTDGREMSTFDVRHLFISELMKEHALAADTDFRNGSFSRRSFWLTKEGNRAEEFYHKHTHEFWRLVTTLLRRAGPRLKSLSLLSSINWFISRGTLPEADVSSKILGALSGMTFPNLRNLTVNHNAVVELNVLGRNSFQCPTLPTLRMLRIISPIFMERSPYEHTPPKHVHPLVANVTFRCEQLAHITLCDDLFRNAEEALKAVFGDDWEEVLEDGFLPGNLQRVTFQQGIMPFFGLGTGFTNYRRRVHNFVETIQRLSIEGLEAHLPSSLFPGEGLREYELLLAEWKERCLSDSE